MALIVALSIAGAIAIYSKKRIEETICLAIFAIISLIYLSGLFTSFLPGVILSIALAGVCFFYVVIKCVRDRKGSFDKLFTPGLMIYIILAVYFLAVSYGRWLNKGTDEYHHWAIAVKYFYMLNDFSNVPLSTDNTPYHCPGVGLFCYFTTRLWVSCSESFMMWGQQLLAVSLFMPLTKHIRTFKSYGKITLTTLFIMVVPYCLRDIMAIFVGYTTFQPDLIQYLLFALGIINFREYYSKKERFYFISLVSTVVMMVLSKRTGIITVMIFLFVITAAFLMDKQEKTIKQWMTIISCLVASLITFLSWDMYIRLSGGKATEITAGIASVSDKIPGGLISLLIGGIVAAALCILLIKKFQNSHPFGLVLAVVAAYTVGCFGYIKLKAQDPILLKDALLYVVHSLFGHDVYGYSPDSVKLDAVQIGHGFPISVGLFLLLVFILWRYVIGKDRESVNEPGITGNLIVFSLVGYYFLQLFRLLGAVTSMAYKEQPNLAVAENYLGPYLIALMVILAYLWLEKKEKVEALSGRTVCIILAGMLVFFDCSTVFTNLIDKPEQHHFYALDDFEFEFGDRVFLMDTNVENENLFEQFYYQAAPAKIKSGTWYADGFNGQKYTVDEVTAQLTEGKFDYVYIENLGPDFKEYYADLFENPEDLDNNHIYSVITDGNSVKLRLHH